MLVADRQGRSGLAEPWLIGKVAKEYRAVVGEQAGDRTVRRGTGRALSLEGLGDQQCGDPDLGSGCDCERDAAVVQQVFRDAARRALACRCRRHLRVDGEESRAYLEHERPLARIGVVYSQQTAWYYGGAQAQAKVENYGLGWYQALVESRIPFEMVHDKLLDAEHLAAFKTLILPNIAVLSDAQCEQIARVCGRRAAALIATHETSLYDETGARRKNFALADLFGVDWTGKSEGPMQNSYIRLEHEALPKSAFFAGS